MDPFSVASAATATAAALMGSAWLYLGPITTRRNARALARAPTSMLLWVSDRPDTVCATIAGLSAEITVEVHGVAIRLFGLARDIGLRNIAGRQEIETASHLMPLDLGDQGFESRFRVLGDLRTALAVLGPEQRTLLETSGRRGLQILDLTDGVLQARLFASWRDPEALARNIEEILHALASLRAPDQIPARLLDHLKRDHNDSVRERCLLELIRGADAGPRRAALDFALTAPHAPLRLIAALVLGRRAECEAAVNQGALRSPVAVGALSSLLTQSAPPVLRRSLGLALCRQGGPESRAAGALLLAGAAQPGDTEAEDMLLHAGATPDPVSLAPLAAAFARVGTVRCVPTLRHLEGLTTDPQVRTELERARLAVQARAKGAEAGGLALAPTDGARGELALTGGGELAVAGGGELGTPDPTADRAPSKTS